MKGKKKKIFSGLLAAIVALSLLPTMAFATAGDDSNDSSNSGIKLSKTATLEDDGTYTINLEAYATGEVTTSSSANPTDIVLLLDLSGSMSNPIGYKALESVGYSYNTISEGTYYYLYNGEYYEVKAGTTSIINKSYYLYFEIGSGRQKTTYYLTSNGVTTKTSERTTVSTDTATIYTGVLYTTDEARIDALKKAVNSFIDLTAEKNKDLNGSQQHQISIVKFSGNLTGAIGNDTYTSASYTYNYTQIVKKLTPVSGDNVNELKKAVDELEENGCTAADYGLQQAQNALMSSVEGREKVIILFTDGEPNHGSGFDEKVAADAVNTAKALKADGTTIYTISVLKDSDPVDTTSDMNEYMHAVSSNYLNAVADGNNNITLGDRNTKGNYYAVATSSSELSKIFEEISSSIGSTTVTLDSNAVLKDIISDEFSLPEGFDETNDISVQTAEYEGNGAFSNNLENPSDVTVSVDDKEICVSGFNYKENYVIDGSEDGNVKTSGKKLIVTIRGVEATEAAATGSEVSTNNPFSGIYASKSDTEPAATFNQPKTTIAAKTYVLDYAKTAELTGTGLTASHLDANGMSKFTTANTDITDKYGKVKITAGNSDEGEKITYTPTTTNWNGYDNFYAFGKNSDNANTWTKISVLPANNVYYEDTFETSEESGTVGIVYSGNWTTGGTEIDNTEEANNSIHGWIDSMADDTTYSDGSAHVSSTANATATFTFTGTGVDIYSRTNDTTGTIYVTVKNTINGTTTTKRTVVDNKANSGDYYQIPTYTFQGEYGTYEVTVRVTAAAASEGRYTYYLDGIRVYNPLGNSNDDVTVKNAYGDEVNAVFTEVRSLLDGSGSVAFVDENADGEAVEADYLDSEYSALAPEHEIYLGKNQSIVLKTDFNTNNLYYLGLKAPGGSTSVAFSKNDDAATTSINHASDLYYKVTPASDGTIVVRNTGDNLLSITKLRTVGTGETGLTSISSGEPVAAVLSLRAANTVEYSAEAVPEEDLEEGDSGQEIEPGTPEDSSGETGDVVIDNPEDQEEESSIIDINGWIKNLFNGFKRLFGRR